jgi:hypothetical protein
LLAESFRVASLDNKLIGAEIDRLALKQDILKETEKLRQDVMCKYNDLQVNGGPACIY